ncbi:MAG: BMP family ABC transporter substrate-binding protein [Oscillospiraceae bacterium]|nr:BMP family ABC transporter substrate-binding protein [Oscillospiraceae bacterium]
MKRILAIVMALVLVVAGVVCLTACKGGNTETPSDSSTSGNEDSKVDVSKVKLGVICLHDEDSTYDLNFINAVKEAQTTLGLSDDQVIIKRNIPESNQCYEAAADLVDEGCNVIFADSFGHEDHMIKAAKEFPNVQFCHATGTKAHTEKLDNYHNAFASIYEGRYLAGIAAGLKLNEMIKAGTITEDQALIGYVGAFTYAEVISGYTSFYLGAKSVCPSVKMNVQFTGSWYDETAEKTTALSLISSGCVLISQHADSMGAPSACEEKNVPNVSYNGSTVESCPNTFIVSSKINWAPYLEYIVKSVAEGKAIDTDWTGTLATGSVQLSEINDKAAAEGTKEAIEEAKAKLEKGELHVFDTATFTSEGKKVESYMVEDTNEVIKDGYFSESDFRSAPYFDLEVDGITRLNVNFG